MKYSPPLDGIRAIAILAVLVYHVFPKALGGGFTGVDVFFVLSGYLIASVILFDLREGSFSMREFYLRRIQRLLPNAAATVLVTVLLAGLLLVPSEAVKTARHGVWALLNLSNVYIWKNLGGYWGDSGEYAPFLHTWSLAVEEQFYLLFPAALLFLSRRRVPRVVAAVAALAAGSFALSLWATRHQPDAAFYLLHTRAWEPLLGALLAAIRVPASGAAPLRPFRPSRATEIAGWAGLAAILAASFLVTGEQPFPGFVALVPTLGAAAVVVSVAEGEGSLSRFLSASPLVLVGKLSYSLYLWHWPGIVLGRLLADHRGFPKREGELFGAALGIAMAVVAYHAVEQPLRRRGPGRRGRLVGLGLGFSAAAAASLFLSLRPATPDPLGLFERPAFHVNLYNAAGDGVTGALREGARYADVLEPPSQPRAADAWRSGGIVHPWGGGTPRVVVLGSSHALMYGKVVDDACHRMNLSVAFLCADGISPWFGNNDENSFSKEFDEARRRALRAWKPDLVLVFERWDTADEGTLATNLRTLADELLASGRHVVLVGQPPVLEVGESVNLREFVSWTVSRQGSFPLIPQDSAAPRRSEIHSAMQALARVRPGVELLRVDDAFCLPDGTVRYAEGRKFFYADDDHLSQAGAEVVESRLAAAIARGCRTKANETAPSRGPGERKVVL
ncbi:MAG: acyltransferase family protein [Holophagales bacterium]|nr:acyltransferase family protein [Holophagales bacterium]